MQLTQHSESETFRTTSILHEQPWSYSGQKNSYLISIRYVFDSNPACTGVLNLLCLWSEKMWLPGDVVLWIHACGAAYPQTRIQLLLASTRELVLFLIKAMTLTARLWLAAETCNMTRLRKCCVPYGSKCTEPCLLAPFLLSSYPSLWTFFLFPHILIFHRCDSFVDLLFLLLIFYFPYSYNYYNFGLYPMSCILFK
jgi:hypothetical protein